MSSHSDLTLYDQWRQMRRDAKPGDGKIDESHKLLEQLCKKLGCPYSVDIVDQIMSRYKSIHELRDLMNDCFKSADPTRADQFGKRILFELGESHHASDSISEIVRRANTACDRHRNDWIFNASIKYEQPVEVTPVETTLVETTPAEDLIRRTCADYGEQKHPAAKQPSPAEIAVVSDYIKQDHYRYDRVHEYAILLGVGTDDIDITNNARAADRIVARLEFAIARWRI